MPASIQSPKQLNVHVDDPRKLIAEFATAVSISVGPDMFCLDFLFQPPGMGDGTEAILLKRVVLAPEHAKRLYCALGAQLETFERNVRVLGEPTTDVPEVIYTAKGN